MANIEHLRNHILVQAARHTALINNMVTRHRALVATVDADFANTGAVPGASSSVLRMLMPSRLRIFESVDALDGAPLGTAAAAVLTPANTLQSDLFENVGDCQLPHSPPRFSRCRRRPLGTAVAPLSDTVAPVALFVDIDVAPFGDAVAPVSTAVPPFEPPFEPPPPEPPPPEPPPPEPPPSESMTIAPLDIVERCS